MAITLSTAARNAACDAIVDLLDAGVGANPTIKIKDASNNVLATIAMDATAAFGSSATGAATATGLPISDASADMTGTATKFDACDTDGTVVFDGTVTATGGGGDIELVTTAIVATQPVEITACTFTMPAS